MTSHSQHPITGAERSVADAERSREGPTAIGGASTVPAHPRWLLPVLAAGIVALALVVTGVLSASTVLYAGLFGGMLLMHLGGHGGHGGHGGGPAGPAGHGGHGAPGEPGDGPLSEIDLRSRSSDTQVQEPGFSLGLDDRTGTNGSSAKTDEHGQRKVHGCH